MALDSLRATQALLRGLGWPRILTGPNPVPGAEAVLVVPGGFFFRPLDFRLSLVASGAVANRRPILTVDDGTTTGLEVAAQTNITAGQTWTLHFAAELGHAISDPASFVMEMPFPRLVLPPGFRMRTVTSLLDVADDYAVPRCYGLVIPWGGVLEAGS